MAGVFKGMKIMFYAILIAIFIAAIMVLKGYTFQKGNSIIYGYAFLITIFMLSRIMGSFFYTSYNEKLPKIYKKGVENYNPTLTFIIPCKNEEKVIYKTIASCFQVNYPKDKIEVIAVNDGSTDNTLKEMLRAKKDFPNRNLQIADFKTNRGKREGMAYGFRNASGEIVVQLDSDSFPEKNSIKRLITPFIDPRVGASVGHTEPFNKNESWITRVQTAYYFMSFRALKATESMFDMVFCCSGCYSAYRKKYVMPVLDDWLNETFMGKPIIFGDDRALTNWMIRKNYKTVYIDDAKASTVVPNTLKKFLKQQVRWKKGWFINSVRILPAVMKKDKFVALTYFLPLILITLLTPFIAFKVFIINPIFYGVSPHLYVIGVFLVSFILVFHYKIYSEDKYAKYMLDYSLLNLALLCYITVYALYDLKNMKWGTR